MLCTRPLSSLMRHTLLKIRGTAVSRLPSSLPLLCSHRCAHIGHSTDIHRWRNPEKEEVKRHFNGGVKLGSEISKIKAQEEREMQLVQEDKFTNWRVVYAFSLGVVVLLGGLNLLMVFVEPNPSPVYVPYVDPATVKVEEKASASAPAEN